MSDSPKINFDYVNFAVVMRGSPIDCQRVVDFIHDNTDCKMVYMKRSDEHLEVNEVTHNVY